LDSSDEEIPDFVVSIGSTVKSLNLLPSKSTARYNKEYVLFSNWVRILETRERPVECDKNSPLSACSVTFYQHFSWEYRFLLSRTGPLE